MWMYWFVRGHLTEGRQWLETLLHAPGAEVPSAARAKALFTAGILAFYQRDHEAGRKFHEEGLVLQRQVGDRAGIADALFGLAQNAFSLGDLTEARTLHQQALDIRREVGDFWKIALSLGNLGLVLQELREHARARRLIEECLAIRRAIGDRRGTGAALVVLGRLVQACGEFELAHSLYSDALAIVRELDDQWSLTHLLAGLAGLMSALGQWELACRLGDAAVVASRTSGNALFPGWQEQMDLELRGARLQLGPAVTAETSLQHSVDELIATALAMEPARQVGADRLGTHGTAAMPLTGREREVAALVARGYSNHEIATALTIAPRTAAAHLEHILRKLGMTSRAQVARWATSRAVGSVEPGKAEELAAF
jgi:non-specific serine/threonine protein kinase